MNTKEIQEFNKELEMYLLVKNNFLNKFIKNLPLNEDELFFRNDYSEKAHKIFNYAKANEKTFTPGRIMAGIIVAEIKNRPYDLESVFTILPEGYFMRGGRS